MRFLNVDRAKCTGCRVCEYACALAKEGVANPAWSRVRVQRPEPLQRRTLVCLQCKRPRCIEACPAGAIRREGERVRVHAELCDRCGACVTACDRLFLPPEGPVLMCDQCAACVSHCPEEALAVTTAEELRQSRGQG